MDPPRVARKNIEAGVRSCTNVSGLELELMLRAIMEIRAHPISLATMPRRAIRVISSRMRWEDQFSISSFSLADLGEKNDRGVYIAVLLIIANSLTMVRTAAASRVLGRRRHRSDLEVATAMQNAPGDASEFVGERYRQYVAVKPF